MGGASRPEDVVRHPAPARLRAHELRLDDGDLVLRPMTEQDWPLLHAWNSDPEVLYYAEGDDVGARSMEEVQRIYRSLSAAAYMFVIEVDGRPIGECQLQAMNLRRVIDRYPGRDLRRIDIAIGDKQLWGRGYGARAIRLLTRLGFDLGADAIFAVDIADYNPRSRRAFEKAGYELESMADVPQPAKARQAYTLIATRPP